MPQCKVVEHHTSTLTFLVDIPEDDPHKAIDAATDLNSDEGQETEEGTQRWEVFRINETGQAQPIDLETEPNPGILACPTCQGTTLSFAVDSIRYYRVTALSPTQLSATYVTTEDMDPIDEAHIPQRLFCDACGTYFVAPADCFLG